VTISEYIATAIRSGEQPSLPIQSHTAESVSGYLVAPTNMAINQKAAEALPSLLHMVYGLGDIGMARELGGCRAQSSRSVTSGAIMV
jgi:hypothetical protein